MKRRLVLTAAATITVAALFAGCKKEEAPAPTADASKAAAPAPETVTVKIGSASPLTGPQAHIGIDIRNGVQLAIEDANAAGVEIGGQKVKFELVAEDDDRRPEAGQFQSRRGHREFQLRRFDSRIEDLFGRRRAADLAFVHESQ